jgi:MFS transporter, DHA3 family, macrolide efflux protein
MLISLEALKNRNASRIFYGQLISQICDKMMTVGLIWVISKEFTAEVIPWFLALSALPHLLLAWTSGAWIGRWGPLKTVIWSDLARGGLFITLAFAWPALSGGSSTLAALLIASFLANGAGALFNPAILSLPVYAVEEPLIPNVTAMIDTCFSIGNVLGPALSAILYPWLGLRGLFLLNGLSYFFAGCLEAGIRLKPSSVPADSPSPSQATPSDWKSLWRVLNQDPLVRFMLLTFLGMNLFLGPLFVFLPLFVQSAYHGELSILAQFEMAIGIGTVGGGLYLSLAQTGARGGQKTGVKILTCMAILSLAYAGFAFSHFFVVACVFLAVLGFALAVANVLILSQFQIRPAPTDVPVVMSLVNLISVASLPLSMTVMGWLMAKTPNLDIHLLAVAFGGILSIITAIAALNPRLRRLEQ